MPHLQSRNRRSSSRRSVSRRKPNSRRNFRRKPNSRRNSRRKSKSRRNSRSKPNSRLKQMMSSVNHPNARAVPVDIQPGMYVRIGENGINRTGFGKWARVIQVTDDKAILKFNVSGNMFQYLEIDRDICQLTVESEGVRKPPRLIIQLGSYNGFTTDDERYHYTLNPTPEDNLRREAEEDALYND